MPTFLGDAVSLAGEFPTVGSVVKTPNMTNKDLKEVSISDFKGKKILNIFPSVDTPTCAKSVRRFNEEASKLKDVSVLCISADTPFAQNRFCGAEGLENVHTLSTFRNSDFGKSIGVQIAGGALDMFLCRALVVLDDSDKVLFVSMTQEISEEPDYEGALKALK
eukprot:GHVH01011718.1.p1 GENE.GHVH01011718.1~~GHVH01011718.1.p1  ORF type:complete len:164 (+),score=26.65 GHVH01011718.1:97-588(+)